LVFHASRAWRQIALECVATQWFDHSGQSAAGPSHTKQKQLGQWAFSLPATKALVAQYCARAASIDDEAVGGGGQRRAARGGAARRTGGRQRWRARAAGGAAMAARTSREWGKSTSALRDARLEAAYSWRRRQKGASSPPCAPHTETHSIARACAHVCVCCRLAMRTGHRCGP
jgi:hypothetical protein